MTRVSRNVGTAGALNVPASGNATSGQVVKGSDTRLGWTTLSQAASQNVTNQATLQNSNTLTFSMLANTKYRIRGRIFLDTTATGDIKYGFSQPSSPTLVRAELIATVAGGTPAFGAIGTSITASAALTGTGTTGAIIMLDAVYHNGANAASFTFQFAQNTQTNDAGVTVLAGSYLEYAVA